MECSESSRPAGARGLKLVRSDAFSALHVSRPAGARGLKHSLLSCSEEEAMSRPAGARGLKPYESQELGGVGGRAPRGAWIETYSWIRESRAVSRAPCGRVD